MKALLRMTGIAVIVVGFGIMMNAAQAAETQSLVSFDGSVAKWSYAPEEH